MSDGKGGKAIKVPWFGSGVARCKACGARFHFREMPEVEHREPVVETHDAGEIGVPYVQMQCVSCGGQNVRITSTRRPIRWHRCEDCGGTFKSFEKGPLTPPTPPGGEGA